MVVFPTKVRRNVQGMYTELQEYQKSLCVDAFATDPEKMGQKETRLSIRGGAAERNPIKCLRLCGSPDGLSPQNAGRKKLTGSVRLGSAGRAWHVAIVETFV
jgi:hypothetical protein